MLSLRVLSVALSSVASREVSLTSVRHREQRTTTPGRIERIRLTMRGLLRHLEVQGGTVGGLPDCFERGRLGRARER